MNCPGSVSMFAQGLKSYRDLPLRMAEFGKVHRYEPSGALHGLMRVRHFTQDDAHIYCTEPQMEQECIDVVRLVLDIYKDFGFDDVIIKLSTRPENRIGSDEVWDKLEGALSNALDVMGLDYILFPGAISSTTRIFACSLLVISPPQCCVNFGQQSGQVHRLCIIIITTCLQGALLMLFHRMRG